MPFVHWLKGHCCCWCLQSAYEAFMKQNPELEAFEAELKKYMAIETEVSNISPVYNIGKQACGCAWLAKHYLTCLHLTSVRCLCLSTCLVQLEGLMLDLPSLLLP